MSKEFTRVAPNIGLTDCLCTIKLINELLV